MEGGTTNMNCGNRGGASKNKSAFKSGKSKTMKPVPKSPARGQTVKAVGRRGKR